MIMYKVKLGGEIFVMLELSDIVSVTLLLQMMCDFIGKEYTHVLDDDNLFFNYVWSAEEAKDLINKTLQAIYDLETSGERVGFKFWMRHSRFFKDTTDVDGVLDLMFKSTNIQ